MFPSKNKKNHDFFMFTDEIHKMVECNKSNCNILLFLKALEEVHLDDENKYEDMRKILMNIA